MSRFDSKFLCLVSPIGQVCKWISANFLCDLRSGGGLYLRSHVSNTYMRNVWENFRRQPNCEKADFIKLRTEVVQLYLKKYGRPSTSGARPKTSTPLSKRVDNYKYKI